MKGMDDLFFYLELETSEKETLDSFEKLTTHLTEKLGRRVLLLGESGSGKFSLMSQIARAWSNESPSLQQFDLVFLLKMGDLHSCNSESHCQRKGDGDPQPEIDCSLLGEIFRQIPGTKCKDTKQLQEYMQSNSKRILILLSGWEDCNLETENLLAVQKAQTQSPESEIERILIGETFQSSCVILSSCPYKSGGFSGYTRIHLNEKLSRCIDTVCSNPSDVQIPSEKSNKSYVLHDIAKFPMMLMLFFWLWGSKKIKTLPERITELYDSLTQAMWTIYERTREETCYKTFDDGIEEVLTELGRDASGGAFELEAGLSNVCVKLGLIRHTHLSSDKISFVHKSVREYCAMYYLKDRPEQLAKFFESVNSWSEVLKKQVSLLFACGVCSRHDPPTGGVQIMEQVVRTAIAHRQRLQSEEIDEPRWVNIDSDEAQMSDDTEFDILPILRMVYESNIPDNECMKTLFIDLLGSDQVRIFCSDQLSPILKYFVTKSGYGSVTFEKVKSIIFKNQTYESLDVVADTLLHTKMTEYVEIEIRANDESMQHRHRTELGKSLKKLSKLKKLLVFGSEGGALFQVDDILYNLSKSQLNFVDFSYTRFEKLKNMGNIFTPRLQNLRLRYGNLSMDHIAKLAKYFPDCPNLEELLLTGNQVKKSISRLIENLKKCSKLAVLGLQKTHLDDDGVTELAKQFDCFPLIERLELEENDITNRGLHNVFEHSKKLQELTYLSISATLDKSCSKLVKKCLIELEEEFPEEEDKILIRADVDKVKSIQTEAMVPYLVKWFHSSKTVINTCSSL